MAKGNTTKKQQTEYERFKDNEPEYIESMTRQGNKNQNGNGKKRKDWVYWLVAVIVVTFSIIGVTNHMVNSREELTQEEQIAKLSAVEAVEQLFDENQEWIRQDVTQEEFDQVNQKVDDLTESSEKVKISSLLGKAEEQLTSQLEGQALVKGLTIDGGEANVDLEKADLLESLDDFPSNYNPEYVEELKEDYSGLAKKIAQALELQERIRELGVEMDTYLNKSELDKLNKRVEDLPFSDRKSQLTYDMKALYSEYDKQQKELEEQRAREQRQREAEEAKRKEEEAIRKAEQERLEEIERQAREQLEWEREQQRLQEEERQRIEDLNEYNNSYNNNGNTNTGEDSTEYDESTDLEESESVETEESTVPEAEESSSNNSSTNGQSTQESSESGTGE